MALAEASAFRTITKTIENLIKYVPDAIINGNSVNNDSIAISEMLFDIIMP